MDADGNGRCDRESGGGTSGGSSGPWDGSVTGPVFIPPRVAPPQAFPEMQPLPDYNKPPFRPITPPVAIPQSPPLSAPKMGPGLGLIAVCVFLLGALTGDEGRPDAYQTQPTPQPTVMPTPTQEPHTYLVHYTHKAAYDSIIATGTMKTGGGERGNKATLFFVDTAPFPVGSKIGTGPYDPMFIAYGLGIPNTIGIGTGNPGMGAAAAEYYVVIDKNLTHACDGRWWTRSAATGDGRLEYNCGQDAVGTMTPIHIVKHGRTEDLNNGNDVIHPVLLP